MKLPRSRDAKRGNIQIIPMIDVMFFLLATFMLASLSLQNLHSLPVNLPQGKIATTPPQAPVTLTVTHDDRLYLDKREVRLGDLGAVLKKLLKGRDTIIVAADQASRNGVLVKAMLVARQAGVRHFLIAVRKP